ncbi:MAG: hypothetical protein V1775_07430 [Bacteroidota bacterium]
MNKQELVRNLINIPGWRTRRHLVVFESDDWGSIRIPSREVYEILLSSGLPVDEHYFTKNDCLESNDDLELLFEVLTSRRDRKGNHPVITANAVVANPDFDKIKAAGFSAYHYELIGETYKSYPNHSGVMKLWLNHGIGQKLLWPQFHGREHLNVSSWLRSLNTGVRSEKLAFSHKAILGMPVPGEPVQPYNYMAAFEYLSESHKKEIELIALSGLELFEKVFGFQSRSFVASCSIQGEHLDPVIKEGGVLYHQCGQQYRPLGNGRVRIINKLWGQKNKSGQTYWRRNCLFEPSRKPEFDWAGHCMKDINIAFRWGKPAVINSHRVNYSGGIFESNRDNSLVQLKQLIDGILKRWPDAEFITSEDLGNIMTGVEKTL